MAERIESPEWKDTITTKDVGADVTFSTLQGVENVTLLIWKSGNSRCMPMLLIHQFDAMAKKPLGYW